MLLTDEPELSVDCFELDGLGVLNEIRQVKAAEICHECCVCGVGKEEKETKGLHHQAVGEDDDDASGSDAGEALDGIAGAAEEEREGLRTGAFDMRGIFAVPVIFDVRQLLRLRGSVMAGWIKEGELVDGPLFHGDIGEALQHRLGGLAGADVRRVEEQRGCAGEAVCEGLRLRAAHLRQGIVDVIGRDAACVGYALSVANEDDSGDRRRG